MNFTICGGLFGVKNDDKNIFLNIDVLNINDMEMRVDFKLNFGFFIICILNIMDI